MAGRQSPLASAAAAEAPPPIAGAGSRSYAFIVDWHIRLLIASAWILAGAWALHGDLGLRSRAALFIWIPAASIYFLYHPLIELVLRGQSPGKRIAGVRIVARDGRIPSHGAILIRNVFRLVDSLPLFYLVGLASCIVTENHLRIGDIAAGTRLVQAPRDAPRRRLGGARQEALELADQLLRRWPSLEPERRADIARALLVRLEPGVDPRRWAASGELELHGRLQSARAARHGGGGD
ncbi:MAG TPA: RDD family protein [Steroidobacteraceae bacterium]|nr:RDD family protein [Steroidobacteraceae bacterium]